MVICVYGAASNKIDKSYIIAVEDLGRKLSKRGHALVYGAGNEGLMGAAARGVYENGGKIIGVAPSFFNVDGVLFPHCTELISTDTMRRRKQIMEDNADAFVMLPGGVGTFDEFFEILTLKQLNRHHKAIVIYNINHYFDDLLKMMQTAVEQGFIEPKNLALFSVFDSADAVLDYIETYQEQSFTVEELRNI